jgi:hypothetical protein
MMKAMGYALSALGLGGCGFFIEKTADSEKASFDQFFLSPRQAACVPYRKTAREHLKSVIGYLKASTTPTESQDGRVYRAIFGNLLVEHCDSLESGYTRITCKKFFDISGMKGKYELEIPDDDMDGMPDPKRTRFNCVAMKMSPQEGMPEMRKFLGDSLVFVAANKQRIYELMLETLDERRGEDVDLFSTEFVSRILSNGPLDGFLERRK